MKWALAVAASACGLLVGIGDHHLREEPAEETGPDSGLEATADEVNVPDAVDDDGATDAELDGGFAGGPVELARDQQNPSQIAVDSSQLYWVNESASGKPGAIMAMRLDGGAPRALAPNRQHPVQLRVDSIFVYFTDDYVPPAGGTYGLFRVPQAGGAVEPVDVEDGGLGYGALGKGGRMCSEAYAVDGGGVWIRCSDKNPPQQGSCYPYAQPARGARLPAIVGDSVYAYAVDPTASAIMRASLTDCTGASTTTYATTPPGVRHLTFHGQFLVWVTASDVYHLDVTKTGAQPSLVATGFAGLASVTGYLQSGLVVADEARGEIAYVHGPSTNLTLASGQSSPRGVASDAQGVVYWTNRASGQIMMIAP
jgi:hypothetical protein